MGLYFWVGCAEVGPALAPYKLSWWHRVHPALHTDNSGQRGDSLKLTLRLVPGGRGAESIPPSVSAVSGVGGEPRGRRGSLSCPRGHGATDWLCMCGVQKRLQSMTPLGALVADRGQAW